MALARVFLGLLDKRRFLVLRDDKLLLALLVMLLVLVALAGLPLIHKRTLFLSLLAGIIEIAGPRRALFDDILDHIADFTARNH